MNNVFLSDENALIQRRFSVVKTGSEDRVYVDEAGVEDTLSWAYGWSRKGSRCQGERLGHRTSRISMAAAWCCGQVLSPLTFGLLRQCACGKLV